MAHGYDQKKVQGFFAPLARGVDMIDHTQHAREFYAYVNATGHLVNESIVASMSLLQELSNELTAEAQPLMRLRAPWGTYVGFAPAIVGLEWIGLRLIGMVSLKGLDQVDVGEIAPFAPGEVEATPVEPGESLVGLLRQIYHEDAEGESATVPTATTHERHVPNEIVICAPQSATANDEVLIGVWDPISDDVLNPIRIPRGDFLRLFSLSGDLTPESLDVRKEIVRDIYQRLSDRAPAEPVPLATYRARNETEAFVLGEVVEKL